MLTLVRDPDAVELVGIFRNKSRSKRPEKTVYFTHDAAPEKQNVAPAAGVLELHRDSLKKINKISQASFERICGMLSRRSSTDAQPGFNFGSWGADAGPSGVANSGQAIASAAVDYWRAYGGERGPRRVQPAGPDRRRGDRI